MTYDEADNLVRLFSQPVSGSGQVSNTSTYDYDLLNRRVRATDARNGKAYYQYDLVGNRTALIDRNGKRRDFGYDELNRLTSETWHANADPNSTVVGTVSYAYNPLNKVTSATNANGSYTITYDGLGRATTVAGPFNSTLTYSYDKLDHRLQVADGFGGTTVSSYDAAGRLTARTTDSPQGNSVQVSWGYDVTDELTSMTYKEEVESSWLTRSVTSYTYNDSGKLSQIRTVNGSNVAVEQLDYQYDVNGNVKQQDRTANPDVNAPGIADAFSSNVGLFNLTSNLSYDANGQLIAANGNTISYDGLGNREGVGWQINLGNRLDYDVRYGYGYDDEGNLTSKRDLNSGETWQYTYDNANRLIEVRHYLSNPSASPAPPVQDQLDFQYDAFGNRIERTETVRNKDGSTSATTTRYAYDGQNVYADLSGSAVSVRYVRADETDSLAARMDSVNGVVWYLTDRLGSAVTLLNSQGQAVRRQAYDPLTQQVTTISISTLQDRYSTGGREEEPKAGLRYERGRWYDANVGRWVNEDSEGFANGDINQYRYQYNNPLAGKGNSVGFWGEMLLGAVDFVGGVADTVTVGLTARLRSLVGLNQLVDTGSAAYRIGGYVGQVVNIGLMVNPAGMARMLGAGTVKTVSGMQMAGGVIAGVEAGANMVRAWNSGDTGGAISNGVGFVSFLAGAALSGVRMGGKVTPCDWGSQAGAWAQRALYGITTGASLYGAGSRIAEGDYVGGALDLLTTGISMRQMMKACFTGRMLMDVEHGKKRVDRVRVDDLLWTRDENNPAGPVQLKRVLQVFVRVAPILNLHVGGQIIETTAEHPFYVCGRGWILGGMLKKGDLLQTRSGESVPVEGVADSGRVETVYNFEIEDDHTYFVGSLEWGFSVWAHNLSCEVKETKKGPNKGQKTIVITDTK